MPASEQGLLSAEAAPLRRCLRRYCGMEVQSAGLGGSKTTVPLAGTRDVLSTTCKA
ncbi:UNVERIFIED_CONTAM: hypothetical protein Slati_2258400 [Sesamum latifolium]|uniref:Uncharacterized protein n=1 Tax=Sesamum latifolium TaxID=2727402 RepID=A0AAW2WUB5_9LAMI